MLILKWPYRFSTEKNNDLFSPASMLLMLSMLVITACGGSSDSTEPSDNPSKIEISGSILIPGGTTSTENPLGLQVAANKSVSLLRIDNQGQIIGDALDTSTSDAEGGYVLLLPDDVEISSNLIVEVTLGNNETPMKAIVIGPTTDIDPISDYIATKIIDEPDLDLNTLPSSAVTDLIAFLETLNLTPQPTLAEALTEIAALADTQIEIDLHTLAGNASPRVTLSGILSIPLPDARGNISQRIIPDTEISLYQVDANGVAGSTALATVTTDANGNYSLDLPEGLSLSSDLILRATSGGETVNAFVVNEALNIDSVSQYVFGRIIDDPDLDPTSLVVADIYKIVQDIEALDISEGSSLTDMLALINTQADTLVTAAISTIKVDAGITPTVAAPVPVLSFGIKQLVFNWSAVSGATHYQLLENPDGASGFSQIGSDLGTTTASKEIPVHLHDWVNAKYIIAACDAASCTNSSEISGINQSANSIGYLKASNTDADDYFGSSISISADGNTVAVGADFEGSNASGINGDQANNSLSGSGAVYIFTKAGSTWTQQAYVKPFNPGANDRFGSSLSLSSDGNILAVGAHREDSNAIGVNGDQTDNSTLDSGAVYVYTRTGITWSQEAYLKASNTDVGDAFGVTLSISPDGSTLAVGASAERSNSTGINSDQTDNSFGGAGAVYVFTNSSGSWLQQAYVKASTPAVNGQFGESVSLSIDGNILAVGAPFEASNAAGINGDETDNSLGAAGAAYVFTRAGSVWTQQVYIKASNPGFSDNFGYSIFVSSNGSTLAVGAYREDSSATGIDGDQLDNTKGDTGAVYVFTNLNSVWMQQAYIKALNTRAQDNFGVELSLSSDGNTLAVGAEGDRSAAIGMNGDPTDDSLSFTGAVHIFTRAGSTWIQQSYAKASNTKGGELFGHSLSLSADGNSLAVGAQYEASVATGVNSDQADSTADGAGAVYLY